VSPAWLTFLPKETSHKKGTAIAVPWFFKAENVSAYLASTEAGILDSFDQVVIGYTAFRGDHGFVWHTHIRFGNTFNPFKCRPHFFDTADASRHAGYLEFNGFGFRFFSFDFACCACIAGDRACSDHAEGQGGHGTECQ